MEDITRIEKFEKEISNISYFIDTPISYLYDHIESPTNLEVIECLRAIIYNNQAYLESKASEISKLRDLINIPFQSNKTEVKEFLSNQEELKQEKKQKDLSDYIKLILFSELNEETSKKLSSLSKEDKISIKLHFLKLINETKKAIKESILKNPFEDIRKLQSDLSIYELAIEFIRELDMEELLVESQEEQLSRIIFAPTTHNTTHIFDDIINYKENKKEIKNIIDKLVDGYFLQTKDIKSIEGLKTSNLYEYRHPNGIRILYVVHKGLIFICSLFYKDKQKSTKIESYYEDAIKRFNSCKDYVLDNYANPDFYIEQDELLGQIYSFVDDLSYSKKVGE